MEYATLAFLALHPEPSAHHLHQVHRDGETKPRVSMIALGAEERIEDTPPDRLGYAAAVIGHLEDRNRLPRVYIQTHLDRPATTHRLNTVDQEVDQNLLQTVFVATNHGGVRGGSPSEADLLLRDGRTRNGDTIYSQSFHSRSFTHLR